MLVSSPCLVQWEYPIKQRRCRILKGVLRGVGSAGQFLSLRLFFLSYLLYLNKGCCRSASFLSSVYLTLAAESERMDFGSPVLNFFELQL
jgi:hypothetical protein